MSEPDGKVAPEDIGFTVGAPLLTPKRRTRKGPPDPIRQVRGKRALRGGKEAEREVARRMGGRRLINDGKTHNPDVALVKGGVEWGVVEVKNFKIWTRLMMAVDQGQLAARSRKGRPWPMVGLVDKCGPGKRQRILLVTELEDFMAWNGGGDGDA